MTRPVFPKHRLDAMIEAAKKFDGKVTVSLKSDAPPKNVLAFAVPVSNMEWTFFAYPLHRNCKVVSPQFYAGRECSGCLAQRAEHDPGDEDGLR